MDENRETGENKTDIRQRAQRGGLETDGAAVGRGRRQWVQSPGNRITRRSTDSSRAGELSRRDAPGGG